MIEYCGGWGYGAVAWRLMDSIQLKYPTVKIDIRPDYDGPPGRITIFLLEKEGEKKKIWYGTRSQAQNDVDNILKVVGSNIEWNINF